MSALNGFYAAMGAYGWWSWGQSSGGQGIIRYAWPKHFAFVGIGIATTLLLTLAMDHWQVPGDHHGVEAFIAAFAMVATWQMSERALENWIYWTIGDAVAVWYNHWLGYNGYALLNVVYIGLAITGFLRWSKQLKAQTC
jgi:nicotinamide mononucleotide transporter